MDFDESIGILECGVMHDELVRTEPWGQVVKGKFVGCIALSEDLSTTGDVACYYFNVEAMLAEFIGWGDYTLVGDRSAEHILIPTEKTVAEAQIIADTLQRMLNVLNDEFDVSPNDEAMAIIDDPIIKKTVDEIAVITNEMSGKSFTSSLLKK